jgi:methanogenic corrinoid protein MtbC1
MEQPKFDNEILQEIYQAMVDIDEEAPPRLVRKALDAHIDVLKIIEALTKGINKVGDKFEALECFLPELITAANIMEESMTILRPLMDKMKLADLTLGTIVIATLQGDIHDIGRNIASVMLRASGFVVHDLGHDVKPDVIINKAEELKANVIGLSSLLTTSLPYAKDTLRLMKERNLRDKFIVVMGGGAVTAEYSRQVGADGYCADAASGVRVIQQLLSGK